MSEAVSFEPYEVRGFPGVRFVDALGQKCELQLSSNVIPHVWLGVANTGAHVAGPSGRFNEHISAHMSVNLDLAKALRAKLDAFIAEHEAPRRDRTTFVIVQKDPNLLPRVGYPDQGEKLIESLREWVTSNPEAKVFTFEVPGEHRVSSGWLDWAKDKVDAHDAYVALEEETAQNVLANDERLKAPCKSESGEHDFERVGSSEDQLFHTPALAGHQYWSECKHCEAWVPDDGEEDEEESDGLG